MVWARRKAQRQLSLCKQYNAWQERGAGKRDRGKPRVSWINKITDYTGLSAVEAVRAAQDRKDWKVEDSTVLLRSKKTMEWKKKKTPMPMN